ncbi:hypothetical protein ACWIID_00565 [Streptomyces phaeochromogenes]
MAHPGSFLASSSSATAVVMAAGAENNAAAMAATKAVRRPVIMCPFSWARSDPSP